MAPDVRRCGWQMGRRCGWQMGHRGKRPKQSLRHVRQHPYRRRKAPEPACGSKSDFRNGRNPGRRFARWFNRDGRNPGRRFARLFRREYLRVRLIMAAWRQHNCRRDERDGRNPRRRRRRSRLRSRSEANATMTPGTPAARASRARWRWAHTPRPGEWPDVGCLRERREMNVCIFIHQRPCNGLIIPDLASKPEISFDA